MKGLLKYLSPFAPDQSGACSVLYDLGGITVICDAGGCTGNICGFDEPRWFVRKSAIFSAGLRDMDAILGRDDRLVDKLKDTAEKVDAKFAAIIGTPVPAVIATDYRALKRMAEKRCDLPVLAIECTGTRLYDEGEEDTYLELFKKFVEEPIESEHAVGIIGTTPLDLNNTFSDQELRTIYKEKGYENVYCYGMGDGLDAVRKASQVEKNIVVAPAGIKAAEYLQKKYGIPYECEYPLFEKSFVEKLHSLSGKKILIVHQQVAANEIRKEIRSAGEADVTCSTWFMQKKALKEEQDFVLQAEEQFIDVVANSDYDVVIGDALLFRAIKKVFQGEFIELSHFAVSGTAGISK